ncbi:MAG: type II secretion system protein [Sulfuricurvum sp.]|nr:type II secretion system protein [Sulfuricurvum sp.]
MKRLAFTMMELIFVIIVIGLLAALAMPSFNRDTVGEAAEQLANHIRYAQHLAIVDDVYDDANVNWFANRWKLVTAGTSYSVYTDQNNNGAVDAGEAAKDPLTKADISAINLSKFGVTALTATTLAFDNLGRPYTNLNSIYGGLATANVTITITAPEGTATITVRPETGYVSVSYP